MLPFAFPRPNFAGRFFAATALVALFCSGCPEPAPDGQSDHCAVMMKCWYAADPIVANSALPVRFSDDGGVLTETEIAQVRETFGADGACWQDKQLAPSCTRACVQALAATCAQDLPQCQSLDGGFNIEAATGAVNSCADPQIREAMIQLQASDDAPGEEQP